MMDAPHINTDPDSFLGTFNPDLTTFPPVGLIMGACL